MFSYCSVAGEETWDLAGLDRGRRKQKLSSYPEGVTSLAESWSRERKHCK